MEDEETFWEKQKTIIIASVLIAFCFVAAIIVFSWKLEEYQKKRDTFSPLGKLVNVELVANGFLNGTTTKVITDKGFYFVFGAVNAKFGAPVILQKSYGWGRSDCIKIVNTCYPINGESPEPE